MIYIPFERGGHKFSNTTARALASRRAAASVENKMATMQHNIFAFVSSLKLSRRLLYSVRFVFVSTFNLRRGRAFVVGITNLSKQGCPCKGRNSGRPRVSEENVRRIQESFERSPRKSTRRASRELGIPQTTVWCVLRRRLLFKP